MSLLQKTYRVHDILELTEEARDLYMELHKIFGETTPISYPDPYLYPNILEYPFSNWVSAA